MSRTRLKTDGFTRTLPTQGNQHSPKGAGSRDVEMLDVVVAENFSKLLDPLVLGMDGEGEPGGPGDGDNLLQVAVDVLLILERPETHTF